jgi:hypothetical protein
VDWDGRERVVAGLEGVENGVRVCRYFRAFAIVVLLPALNNCRVAIDAALAVVNETTFVLSLGVIKEQHAIFHT